MKIVNRPSFFLFIFILATALIIFLNPLLPFVDLPSHLAEATIYKYYYDSENLFSTYYQLTPWYFPNTLYLVFTSAFPSVVIGDKLFFMSYVILMPTTIFLIIRELKGNLWYGLLSFLLIFNYNVTYGFVGFYMAIPITLLLFYTLLLDAKKQRTIYKLYIATLLILLFYLHAQVALFGLIMVSVMSSLTYRKQAKGLFFSALTCVPVILLIVLWWVSRDAEGEGSTLEFLINYYQNSYLKELYRRGVVLVMDHYQLMEGAWGFLIGAFFSFVIIFPALYFKVWKSVNWKQILSGKVAYPVAFFIIAAGCYLTLPYGLPGQIPLYQRFCTLVVLSFLILISTILPSNQKLMRHYVIGALFIYLLLWGEYIFSFNKVNKGMNKTFFADTHEGARLSALIYDAAYRGKMVYPHFPNYYIVWNKGIAASKIIDYRFGIIRRKAPLEELPYYHAMIGTSYKHTEDYEDLEYLLVKGDAPVKDDENLLNFSLLKEEGHWKLYMNNNLK